jgi:hypothetical protein
MGENQAQVILVVDIRLIQELSTMALRDFAISSSLQRSPLAELNLLVSQPQKLTTPAGLYLWPSSKSSGVLQS